MYIVAVSRSRSSSTIRHVSTVISAHALDDDNQNFRFCSGCGIILFINDCLILKRLELHRTVTVTEILVDTARIVVDDEFVVVRIFIRQRATG